MKTTASKENPTPSQSSKPFFSKKGEGGFFGQTQEAEQPFFLPRQQSVIQTKLTINEPGDQYEQEADAMADEMMRMSTPVSEGGDKSMVRTNPLNVTAIQRKCPACEQEEKVQHREMEEEETLQTKPLMLKAADGGYTATPQLSSQLNSSKGGGDPLPKQTLGSMNQAFGADFSKVRVHTGSQAAEMSDGIQAKAFTNGSDIFFNQGQYNPESTAGKNLLAHELVHTVQQGQVSQKVQKKQQPLLQGIEGHVSGLSEEEAALAQKISKLGKPNIQRSTSWAAGAVHETINLADFALGTVGAPITWHMLNGTKMNTEADAVGAIKSPTIVTSNVGGAWKAKVTAVLLNTGSFDETVLMKSPWTNAALKATVGGRFGIAACAGAGGTTFQAKGDPNDNHVFTANRRHEDHHANDHKAAFNDIIKTWDTKVTKAKDAGTEFAGANEAAATANLWAAMGGTPEEIAKSYRNEGFARGAAFHKTPKGGTMGISGNGSDKTCTNSWVEVTNPS